LRQGDGRVLENRSDADGVLLLAALALPKLAGRQKRVLGRPAPRTRHAVRPAHRYREVESVLRVCEVNDCILKGSRFLAAHTLQCKSKDRVRQVYYYHG